jgi:hypothetical protein
MRRSSFAESAALVAANLPVSVASEGLSERRERGCEDHTFRVLRRPPRAPRRATLRPPRAPIPSVLDIADERDSGTATDTDFDASTAVDGIATEASERVLDGSENSLMIGLVTGSLRVTAADRTARQELRKQAAKTFQGDAANEQAMSDSESDIALSDEINFESLAQAPPQTLDFSTNRLETVTDTVQQGGAVFGVSEAEVADFGLMDGLDIRGPPHSESQPRAPPSGTDPPDYLVVSGGSIDSSDAATLTQQELEFIAAEALLAWSEFATLAGLTDRLAAITFTITDLPAGVLAEARDGHVLVSPTAAGHGWFVDATPGEHSEFGIVVDGERLLADPGSDAFGRVDLLTVLIHEIGHVLGFGHDADLAVMAETLRTGERVLVGGEGLADYLAAAWVGVPVSAYLLIGTPPDRTLDLSAETADLTLTVTEDGSGAFRVTVSGATVDTANNDTFDGITAIIGGSGNDTITINVTGSSASELTIDGWDSDSTGSTWTASSLFTDRQPVDHGRVHRGERGDFRRQCHADGAYRCDQGLQRPVRCGHGGLRPVRPISAAGLRSLRNQFR